MNPFKRILNNAKQSKQADAQAMIDFHRRLQDVLDLEEREIMQMERDRIIFLVPGTDLEVAADHRILPGGWQTLLVVRPAGLGDPGYRGGPPSLPPGWIYHPQGTATIYVADKATQRKVLAILSESTVDDTDIPAAFLE